MYNNEDQPYSAESLTYESGHKEQSIEARANFQGNHVELLFKRVQHPNILHQLVRMLSKEDADERGDSPYPDEFYKNKIVQVIETEMRQTFISTDPRGSIDRGTIAIYSKKLLPSGERTSWTTQDLNIINAHEKGHWLWEFYSPRLRDHFREGFDLSVLPQALRDYFTKWQFKREPEKEDLIFVQDYLFNPREIACRMGQLKNYFGFAGDEVFTAEHLAYARGHYTTDCDDNEMSLFLACITRDTQDSFLKIINSSGI